MIIDELETLMDQYIENIFTTTDLHNTCIIADKTPINPIISWSFLPSLVNKTPTNVNSYSSHM